MSQTTETTTTTEATKATKAKSSPKKTSPKPVAAAGPAPTKSAKKSVATKAAPETKEVPAPKEAGEFTSRELRILNALKELGSCTKPELKAHLQMQGGLSKIMGTTTKDAPEATLLGRNLIKCETAEGSRGMVWSLTALGTKALTKATK